RARHRPSGQKSDILRSSQSFVRGSTLAMNAATSDVQTPKCESTHCQRVFLPFRKRSRRAAPAWSLAWRRAHRNGARQTPATPRSDLSPLESTVEPMANPSHLFRLIDQGFAYLAPLPKGVSRAARPHLLTSMLSEPANKLVRHFLQIRIRRDDEEKGLHVRIVERRTDDIFQIELASLDLITERVFEFAVGRQQSRAEGLDLAPFFDQTEFDREPVQSPELLQLFV